MLPSRRRHAAGEGHLQRGVEHGRPPEDGEEAGREQRQPHHGHRPFQGRHRVGRDAAEGHHDPDPDGDREQHHGRIDQARHAGEQVDAGEVEAGGDQREAGDQEDGCTDQAGGKAWAGCAEDEVEQPAEDEVQPGRCGCGRHDDGKVVQLEPGERPVQPVGKGGCRQHGDDLAPAAVGEDGDRAAGQRNQQGEQPGGVQRTVCRDLVEQGVDLCDGGPFGQGVGQVHQQGDPVRVHPGCGDLRHLGAERAATLHRQHDVGEGHLGEDLADPDGARHRLHHLAHPQAGRAGTEHHDAGTEDHVRAPDQVPGFEGVLVLVFVDEGGFGRALRLGDVHAAKARTPGMGTFTASAEWPAPSLVEPGRLGFGVSDPPAAIPSRSPRMSCRPAVDRRWPGGHGRFTGPA